MALNEGDKREFTVNTSKSKNSLHVYLQAHCACGKSAKCEFFLKIYNFKNIIHSCIISCISIAPVQLHIRAKYEDSLLNYIVRKAMQRN